MNKLVITAQILTETFGACTAATTKFREEYPDGLDIAPLWGTDEEASNLWQMILKGWLKTHVGWAISSGIIPAKIRADLRGADLSGANLSRADLRGADLRGASLRGANLRGANLRGANLSRADLSGANLSRADLGGANLRGANLSRANLSGADLSRADLREVTHNQYTIWPEGFVLSSISISMKGAKDE